MNNIRKEAVILGALTAVFLALVGAFLSNLWGRSAALPPIAPVDPSFIDPATVRRPYAELIRAKEDLSDFDCYACHERNKPPTLRYDTNQNLIIPKEHAESIVMGHGQHNRNNNCFNCHDEHNLELLQTRDGRAVTLVESPVLCGSCHGPTYRDWEAGAHGRTSGFWQTAMGPPQRQLCVACHNPHSPRFPGRKPAPGPHPLRPALAHAGQPSTRN